MPMDLGSIPWVVWVVLATIILGLGIAWGQYRASKVTPREEQRTEAAVHRSTSRSVPRNAARPTEGKAGAAPRRRPVNPTRCD